MISSAVDSFLAKVAAWMRRSTVPTCAPNSVKTSMGPVHVRDSGGDKPCVLFVPDGPNVVSHYAELTDRLVGTFRVVCFDMPGFGHSLPSASYSHSLDHGAATVLAVLDALGIEKAILAFSCANGFYAMRVAQTAPHRVLHLVLSQTPSMEAMHAWAHRVVPRVLHVPVLGQLAGWFARRKAAAGWYSIALPKGKDATRLRGTAMHALSCGACFSLAGVVQGLAREDVHSLRGVTAKCTMFWGTLDRSHKLTDPGSLKHLIPHANIVLLESAGHFPDIEEAERLASFLHELARTDVYP